MSDREAIPNTYGPTHLVGPAVYAEITDGQGAALDLADAYAASLRASGRAIRTIEVYRQTVAQLCAAMDPVEAKPADVEAWLAGMNVAPKTLGQYLVRCRGFFRWMIREGYRESNPCEAIDPPKVAPSLPRPLPMEYLQRIWELASPKERAWIALGYFCGLRAGEAIRVAVEDIVDGPALRVTGKGGRVRRVPLRPEVLEGLTVYGWPESGRFFPTANRKSASVAIGRLLREVGAPPIYTMHSLRHAYGTGLYRASRDIRLVQELMGHSSLNTTQMYVAFDDEQARWVVGRLPTMVA
ncbi:MAG: Gordonia phage [Actinomycetota bacterium]